MAPLCRDKLLCFYFLLGLTVSLLLLYTHISCIEFLAFFPSLHLALRNVRAKFRRYIQFINLIILWVFNYQKGPCTDCRANKCLSNTIIITESLDSFQYIYDNLFLCAKHLFCSPLLLGNMIASSYIMLWF